MRRINEHSVREGDIVLVVHGAGEDRTHSIWLIREQKSTLLFYELRNHHKMWRDPYHGGSECGEIDNPRAYNERWFRIEAGDKLYDECIRRLMVYTLGGDAGAQENEETEA